MKLSFAKRLASAMLSTVFSVTTLMSGMPQSIRAEEEKYLYTDDGFAYIVNDEGSITLKGRDPEREDEYDKTKIVLPSKIDGKYVTEIDTNYFGHSTYGSNSTVTEIVLPDHIEKISNWCFNDYKALDTLVIPATLKEAERPFTYCKINKVIIEDGMKTVPKSLFSCTDYMGELVIPDSVVTIGDSSFTSISGLKEIHVPDSVKSIGYCAFNNNPDLEVLDLPDTLDFIDSYAFAENPKLTSVTVPDTWTFGEGKDGFFQKCGLKEITFGPDRKEIPQGICLYCESLETINWPTAPTKIGSRAFEDCYALKDPKIPNSVEIIDSYAFDGCKGITHLDLPTDLKELTSRSFGNLKSLKYLYVPMELPTKGNYKEVSAFWKSGIEKLEFADGITEINAMTASGHPNLTEIVIPKSVTTIRSYAFNGNESLANIDLHEGITTIEGQSVFSDCKSLKELTVPSTLKGEGYAFSSAPALDTLYISEGRTEIPDRLFINCNVLKKAVIPESVTKIKANAFANCYELETVEMKQDNVEVENSAFSRCDSLWDERFSICKKGDLFMTKSSSSNTEGGITNYTIYYSINPNFLDTFDTASLDVSVQPWKHLVIDESLPDGLKAGDVGFKVNLTSTTGIFRFSVRNPENDVVKVTAELCARVHKEPSYEWDKKCFTVTDTTFEPVTINVPDTVSVKDGKSSFNVYGYADIGSKVTIMVNGEEYSTVDTNAYTGKYSASVNCEPVDGVITLQAVCGSKKSDKKQISVDENMPVLVDFEVSHETHVDVWRKNMTDIFRTGYTPYVSYNPHHPLQFAVDLDNDDNSQQILVASKTGDKQSFVPLERNSETGKWTGSGFFDTSIPGDLSIKSIPKNKSDMLTVKKDSEGALSSVKNKDGKELFKQDEDAPKDPAEKFVEEHETKIVDTGGNNIAVSFKRKSKTKTDPPKKTEPDDDPDDYEPDDDDDEDTLNVFEGKAETVNIGGKTLKPIDIIEDHNDYNFKKSNTRVTDENGNVHEYYARVFTKDDSEFAQSLTKSIPLSSNGSDTRTVNDFLTDKEIGRIIEGIAIADYNTFTQTAELMTVAYSTSLTGDDDLDELAESLDVGASTAFILKWGVESKGLNDVAGYGGAVITAVQEGYELYDHYYTHSDRVNKIAYSKDTFVQDKASQLMVTSAALFAGRAAIAAFAVKGAFTLAAAGAAGLAFWPALLAGAALTFGVWAMKLAYNKLEKELDDVIDPVTSDGKINVGIDPSGYVYAAVPYNRIKGATATIYYKDKSGNAVKWNAEDYDQVNPQITDSSGWFMWDVPEGLWQVRIEAEGYENYATEWLPVLPVQTDVNIPLKSTSAAKIESIDAYSNGVYIKMSQYITDSTAVADNVYLTDSKGNVIPCKISFSKSETNETGYSDIITLISTKGTISEAELHITKGLLSYSGVPSEPSSEKIVKIKDSLIVDNDPEIILGDVNNDGNINAVDASTVLSYYAMISTNKDGGFDDAQKAAADVNHDSLINAVDASCILSYYAYTSTTKDTPKKTLEEFLKE